MCCLHAACMHSACMHVLQHACCMRAACMQHACGSSMAGWGAGCVGECVGANLGPFGPHGHGRSKRFLPPPPAARGPWSRNLGEFAPAPDNRAQKCPNRFALCAGGRDQSSPHWHAAQRMVASAGGRSRCDRPDHEAGQVRRDRPAGAIVRTVPAERQGQPASRHAIAGWLRKAR